MAKTFLALGECMVEMAPADGGLYAMGFAGDTYNTAYYTRRLLGDDWAVRYGTCVGEDATSEAMVGFMAGHGIDTGSIRRVPDRTVGLYMIALKDGERSFSYWRGQSAAKTLADDTAWLDAQCDAADVVMFSGITLAILAPEARRRFCDAMARARAAGKTVAFDTNMRPRLWNGPDDMREGLMMGASVADIVLPSFDEETALYGDASSADTIDRYRTAGARMVTVKNGTDTLTVWTSEGGTQTFQPEPARKVVDTTAAGDSFDAGLLAGLLTGQPLENAVHQAMAVSAQVVQARGALVDLDLSALGGKA